eukprot:360056-Chlamydomonas_euryale.AAC.14
MLANNYLAPSQIPGATPQLHNSTPPPRPWTRLTRRCRAGRDARQRRHRRRRGTEARRAKASGAKDDAVESKRRRVDRLAQHHQRHHACVRAGQGRAVRPRHGLIGWLGTTSGITPVRDGKFCMYVVQRQLGTECVCSEKRQSGTRRVDGMAQLNPASCIIQSTRTRGVRAKAAPSSPSVASRFESPPTVAVWIPHPPLLPLLCGFHTHHSCRCRVDSTPTTDKEQHQLVRRKHARDEVPADQQDEADDAAKNKGQLRSNMSGGRCGTGEWAGETEWVGGERWVAGE